MRLTDYLPHGPTMSTPPTERVRDVLAARHSNENIWLSRTGFALIICIFALMPLALPTFGHDTQSIHDGTETHKLSADWDCFTKNGFVDSDGNTLSNFYPLDQDYHFHMSSDEQQISTNAGEPLNYYDGSFSMSPKCSSSQDPPSQDPPPRSQDPPPRLQDPPPSQDSPPETGTTPRSIPSSLPEDVTVSFTRTRYESSEDDEAVEFRVRLSKVASQEVVVDYATASGTAGAGEDYEATSGTLTFPAGTTRLGISVLIIDDNAVEEEESFTISLRNSNAMIETGEATGAIADNDLPAEIETPDDLPAEEAKSDVTVSFAATRYEASEDDTALMFAVQLSTASSQEVTVDYATASGTARAGDDYEVTVGTLTFPAGTTEQTIRVRLIDDKLVEEEESFTIRLRQANATIGQGRATAVIIDNDAPETEQATEPPQAPLAFPEDFDLTDFTTQPLTFPEGMTFSLSLGICSRTPAVRAALLARIAATNHCAFVTDAHLAAIRGRLAIPVGDDSLRLQTGDLAGLTRLDSLDLRGHRIKHLPRGLLAGLNRLTYLDLGDNALKSFPFAAFEALPLLTDLRLDGNPGYESAVAVRPQTLAVVEGSSRTYRMHLYTNPDSTEATVTVTAGAEAASAEPTTLTFTPTNWFRAQPITIQGHAIADAVRIDHKVADYGAVTSGPAVTATVLDPSTPHVEVAVEVVGEAAEGLTVELGRTIADQDHAWSVVTNAYGQADLLLFGPPINGYYRARAWTTKDEVVGYWHSIALNSHRRYHVELTLDGDARVVAVEQLGSGKAQATLATPLVSGLRPIYPNPFNSTTQIAYQLATGGPVRLEVFNIVGQQVRTLVDAYQSAGFYQVVWDARDAGGKAVAAGVYIARLHYPSGKAVRRMLYLK